MIKNVEVTEEPRKGRQEGKTGAAAASQSVHPHSVPFIVQACSINIHLSPHPLGAVL